MTGYFTFSIHAPYIIRPFLKGSRDKGKSQFETGGTGIKQIQSEMGRGNQALKKKGIL